MERGGEIKRKGVRRKVGKNRWAIFGTQSRYLKEFCLQQLSKNTPNTIFNMSKNKLRAFSTKPGLDLEPNRRPPSKNKHGHTCESHLLQLQTTPQSSAAPCFYPLLLLNYILQLKTIALTGPLFPKLPPPLMLCLSSSAGFLSGQLQLFIYQDSITIFLYFV